MAFKKINKRDGDNILEIKVIDQDRSLLEKWTIKMSDLGKFAGLMRRKYGVKTKTDLDWAV